MIEYIQLGWERWRKQGLALLLVLIPALLTAYMLLGGDIADVTPSVAPVSSVVK